MNNNYQSSLMLLENVSLKTLHTFHHDVFAKYYVKVNAADTASELCQLIKEINLPYLILGEGSNVLFKKTFAELVVHVAIPGITVVSETVEQVIIRVGAGVIWHDLVMHCLAQGLQGLENLSLIPGTVGAAPIQNIGAYGVELKDYFESLTAINLMNGETVQFNENACQFDYRHSYFKLPENKHYLITDVTLRLNKIPKLHYDYPALKEKLAGVDNAALTAKIISDAVIAIRQSKLPDPKQLGNAGSFFKNPIISRTLYEQITESYPDIIHYPVASDSMKIPAAWLIERAGFKGKRIGDVGVHAKQALVLVNYGEGTGAETLALAEMIQQQVFAKFGIHLEPEVNIV